MSHLRYVTHPEVRIDPAVPVPAWGLDERGLERTRAMLHQPWIPEVGRIICSAERKALETAAVIASHLDLMPEVRPDTHENDRSATGFLPPDEFESMADAFFAFPDTSVRGWERAVDAQARMLDALADVIRADDPPDHDIVVVGHGGVGTLLLCSLAGEAIDRRHDQGGSGHYFSYDLAERRLVHPWKAVDRLDPA